MILPRLIALVLMAFLSIATFAGPLGSSTGPTNPVEKPRAPAIQSAPGMNTDGTTIDHNLPPSTGTDPRVQGNDAGRQGGMSLPGSKTPSSGGLGSTTSGDSGDDDSDSQ
ncbi:hypothetical protein [Pseudomonas sp. GM55]|uniref:hypothetical protein n=1 Tax=Pseudomonas sp. GM55 TaxID=1144333 RepID=UPI000270A6FD|nr:hypothetical protein [Pseudomonas sp. GM55]EJM75178.1 hypothetical protein PMI31_01963 [Pseudomonas sp. GM55]